MMILLKFKKLLFSAKKDRYSNCQEFFKTVIYLRNTKNCALYKLRLVKYN